MKPLIRNDVRLLARDRLLWIAGAGLALAIAVGLLNGVHWAEQHVRTMHDQQALEVEWKTRQLRQLDAWEASREGRPPNAANPSFLGGAATQAFLTPAPLGVLGIGDTDLHPRHARVAMWMQRAAQFDSVDLQSPLHLLTGRVDVAFVVVALYPLVLIALSYGLLAEDRADGTLALTLAQPVSVGHVLAARVLVRLMLAAVPPALIVLVTALVAPEPTSSWRLLAWAAVVWAYGAFWVALAAAVNARSSTPAKNALVLAGAWLALVVVVPAGLAMAVERWHPSPSRLEVALALRQAEHAATADSDVLLERHYRDHPELVAPGEDAARQNKVFVVRTREVDRQLAPLLDAFEVRVADQQAAARSYRLASPAMIAQEALNEVAGTGRTRHTRFRDQVRTFQEAWADRYAAMVFAGAVATRADWDERPVFTFAEEAGSAAARRGLSSAAALLALSLLVLGVAALRVRGCRS